MNRLTLFLLIIANVAAAFLALGALNQIRAQQLTVSDLTYGQIDADGDGEYTFGDDWAVEWLLINAPHHIEEALKSAQTRPDGGVDLSTYLLGVRAP